MSQDFQKMLAELKVEYLKELPKKLAEIKTMYESSNAKALREEFHKLKGNGKTYGVAMVSTLCAVVEKIFDTDPELGLKLTPQSIELLEKIQASETTKGDFDLLGDPQYLELLKNRPGAS